MILRIDFYFNSSIKRSYSKMNELSETEQYQRILYLGICFMIMFTSFTSLQGIVSKLYEDYDYKNLGQAAILFLYFAFGFFTIFSPYIVKKLRYKKSMFFSSLGYATFEATGIVIAAQADIPIVLVWIIVIVGAVLCGISSSTLWVAQAGYTNIVASENRKSELFGLFLGLMMSSQILGSLLTTFVLGKISTLVYFIVLSALGFLSSILFLFVPEAPQLEKEQEEELSVKEEFSKLWKIICDEKYHYLKIYFMFPGLAIAFYSSFLYKLIKVSMKQEEGQSKEDYDQRVSFQNGLVLISLGASQLFMGIIMNRFSQNFSNFSWYNEVAGVVSLICYFTNSFPLCFVCACLWGFSQNFTQTNINAVIGILFPKKIQMYGVYRIFFCFGICLVLLLNIALSSIDEYIFLSIVLATQMIMTGVSVNIKDLERAQEIFSDNRDKKIGIDQSHGIINSS